MSKPSIVLDHCVIASSDLARSDAFYQLVLGMEVSAPRADFRCYRLGAQQLNVHGPGLAATAGPARLAAKPVAPGGSDLCFEWRGPIADAVAHLEDCGVPVETGPLETMGARGEGVSVYFRDPDGSLLEFITYPEASAPVA